MLKRDGRVRHCYAVMVLWLGCESLSAWMEEGRIETSSSTLQGYVLVTPMKCLPCYTLKASFEAVPGPTGDCMEVSLYEALRHTYSDSVTHAVPVWRLSACLSLEPCGEQRGWCQTWRAVVVGNVGESQGPFEGGSPEEDGLGPGRVVPERLERRRRHGAEPSSLLPPFSRSNLLLHSLLSLSSHTSCLPSFSLPLSLFPGRATSSAQGTD